MSRYTVQLLYETEVEPVNFAQTDELEVALEYALSQVFMPGVRDICILDSHTPEVALFCERVDLEGHSGKNDGSGQSAA